MPTCQAKHMPAFPALPSYVEPGGGHHSPIAAYNPQADSLLVMDVSRYNVLECRPPPRLFAQVDALASLKICGLGGAVQCAGLPSAWVPERLHTAAASS
eukprot:1150058-Pelagomonas_calceolata.AAC.3